MSVESPTPHGLALPGARSPDPTRRPTGPPAGPPRRVPDPRLVPARPVTSLSARRPPWLLRTLRGLIDSRPLLATEHSRIVRVGVGFGQLLGLPRRALADLAWGLLLHDVGKLAVPDAILQKSGRLTDFEYTLVKKHPAVGEVLLAEFSLPGPVMEIVRSHHERWDGTGYPDGLAGVRIPLLARVASIVDAYDAMTTPRPYRPVPLTVPEALQELRRCSGTQFDPYLVCAFSAVLRARERR